jgi:hypothetical protein
MSGLEMLCIKAGVRSLFKGRIQEPEVRSQNKKSLTSENAEEHREKQGEITSFLVMTLFTVIASDRRERGNLNTNLDHLRL